MDLIKTSLEDRNFLILAESIEKEFGGEIPWLKEVGDLRLSMDIEYFREKFISMIHGEPEQDKVCGYNLVSQDRSKTFLGGMLHFTTSPESFKDQHLSEIENQLSSDGYSYITCLHVKDVERGRQKGVELFSEAMSDILERYPKVWGVVSRPELLSWYRYFGANIQNCFQQTNDKLSIVTFEAGAFRKRSI